MSIRHIFILAIVAVLIIAPASAKIVITAEPYGLGIAHKLIGDTSGVTYDAQAENRAIQRITIDAPIDTQIAYTLYYNNGSAVSGTMHYYDSATIFGAGFVTSDMTMGGKSSSYTYLSYNKIGRLYLYGYAKNETSPGTWEKGFVLAGTTAGVTTFDNDVVFYPVTGSGVINKFSFTSTRLVNIDIITNDYTAVEGAVGKSYLDALWEAINFALQAISSVNEFMRGYFSFIVFLTLNLPLIIALWIVITAAVAANTSKDVFAFFRKWFGYQKSLFKFVLDMWVGFTTILSHVVGLFKL